MQPQEFWQEIHPAGTFATTGPFTDRFPAALPDGRQILLPIRALPDGRHGLASLIINQASFAVQDALAEALAARLASFRPEIVVGLPTLGLTLAPGVARALGHDRFVPLGTSRKFWYDEALSVPMSSITSPGQAKRLFADPRMLGLLKGARVAVIDDVISSGTSMLAALDLMRICGIAPVCLGSAMLQTERWKTAIAPPLRDRVRGVFSTPRLIAQEGGWVAEVG